MTYTVVNRGVFVTDTPMSYGEWIGPWLRVMAVPDSQKSDTIYIGGYHSLGGGSTEDPNWGPPNSGWPLRIGEEYVFEISDPTTFYFVTEANPRGCFMRLLGFQDIEEEE